MEDSLIDPSGKTKTTNDTLAPIGSILIEGGVGLTETLIVILILDKIGYALLVCMYWGLSSLTIDRLEKFGKVVPLFFPLFDPVFVVFLFFPVFVPTY